MIMTTTIFRSTVYKTEDDFTAGTNLWVSHNYPLLRGYYTHIPNESQKGQHHVPGRFGAGDKHRLLMSAMGVLPGVPDFLFLKPYHWWLELKLPNGKASPAQLSLHTRWRQYGETIYICYTPEQVILVVSKVMNYDPVYM